MQLGIKGIFDNADCSTLSGWSQDQQTLTKHVPITLSFDAEQGKTGGEGTLALTADVTRQDLCQQLGTCDHGFAIATPVGLMDGKDHQVYAYSGTTMLPGSPLKVNCPELPFPQGVKRAIATPVFSAWKFSHLLDVAHEPRVQVAQMTDGPAFPATPLAVTSDDGSTTVWVVDGKQRRAVVSPDSYNAWKLASTKWTAAQVNALEKGADWPVKPVLFEGDNGPEVYALDVAPPPAAAGPGDNPDPGAGPQPTLGDVGADSGCTVASGPSRSGAQGLLFAVLGLALAARRRKR
jgi:MYXO-CTERM domain-containing protein